MKDKSTEELLKFLRASDADELLHKVINWEGEEAIPLPTLLENLMRQKGFTKSYVVDRSGLHRTYAYQILQGKKRPGRGKLLCLCIAMQLTYAECQQVLQAAGHGVLYAGNRQDAIVLYALQNRLSVVDTNTLLYECGEATLG